MGPRRIASKTWVRNFHHLQVESVSWVHVCWGFHSQHPCDVWHDTGRSVGFFARGLVGIRSFGVAGAGEETLYPYLPMLSTFYIPNRTHRIHVWYMYLHLVDFMVNVGRYTVMDPMEYIANISHRNMTQYGFMCSMFHEQLMTNNCHGHMTNSSKQGKYWVILLHIATYLSMC